MLSNIMSNTPFIQLRGAHNPLLAEVPYAGEPSEHLLIIPVDAVATQLSLRVAVVDTVHTAFWKYMDLLFGFLAIAGSKHTFVSGGHRGR